MSKLLDCLHFYVVIIIWSIIKTTGKSFILSLSYIFVVYGATDLLFSWQFLPVAMSNFAWVFWWSCELHQCLDENSDTDVKKWKKHNNSRLFLLLICVQLLLWFIVRSAFTLIYCACVESACTYACVWLGPQTKVSKKYPQERTEKVMLPNFFVPFSIFPMV